MSVKRRVFSALDGLIKCDRAIVCSMFLWYLAFLLCIVEATKPGICVMKGCNCTVKAHRWVNIKCVFSKEQARSRSKTCCRCRSGGNFAVILAHSKNTKATERHRSTEITNSLSLAHILEER